MNRWNQQGTSIEQSVIEESERSWGRRCAVGRREGKGEKVVAYTWHTRGSMPRQSWSPVAGRRSPVALPRPFLGLLIAPRKPSLLSRVFRSPLTPLSLPLFVPINITRICISIRARTQIPFSTTRVSLSEYRTSLK